MDSQQHSQVDNYQQQSFPAVMNLERRWAAEKSGTVTFPDQGSRVTCIHPALMCVKVLEVIPCLWQLRVSPVWVVLFILIDVSYSPLKKKKVPGELLTRFPHVVTVSGMGSRSSKAGNDSCFWNGRIHNKTTSMLSPPEVWKPEILAHADSGGALPCFGAL